jgi:hypothetical protein
VSDVGDRWSNVPPAYRARVYEALKRLLRMSIEANDPDASKAIAAALDLLAFTADGGFVLSMDPAINARFGR